MKVRFVYENHRLGRSLRDEVTQFVFRRDAGGGIIRVANVNQTSFCSGKHSGKIVAEAWSEWSLHYLGAIGAGIIKNCFESRISCNECPALFPSECFRANFENLAGTVAEQDLISIDAVDAGQFIDQHVIVLIGI